MFFKKIVFFLSCTVIFTITFAINSKRVESSPMLQSEPRPLFTEIEKTPYLETGSKQLSDVNNVSVQLPWSKLVFQSYRDGNWNIYKGNDDGDGQVLLTTHSGSDIHPDINRGTSKVVYASWRNSDYEIFIMNSDGSGQQALTTNQFNDVYPRWSPDGTKILFESYRNGEADIYIMNADGSAQNRLTTNPAFDGMPSWSPDGRQIAFVSARTGINRIWKMDVDGSNLQQLSQTPSSLYPAWSPDGKQIAFSADGNNNGWLEIWIMDENGANEYKLVDTAGTKDLWVRGWSPDNQQITYTDINFIQYAGNWYWTNAWLKGVNVQSGQQIQLSGGQLDWNPHWQTSDTEKPRTWMSHLPNFLPDNSTISWSGYDVGEAGLAGYDIEYRNVNSEEWTAWQLDTTATEAVFHEILGDPYTFRIRARDAAYNISDWKPSHVTTLYAWGITGYVTDNAGTPVQAANVETIPNSFLEESSLSNGQYTNYVGIVSNNYQTSWSKTGYGNLPQTGFPENPSKANVNIVLPPADDVVSNGGFEIGNLSSWQASGLISPTITTDTVHVGDYAIRLGQATYDIPESIWEQVSNLSGGSTPNISSGPNSNMHVVWTTNMNQGVNVYHRERLHDGSWSTLHNVSNGIQDAEKARFVVDHNNGIHVIWNGISAWPYYDDGVSYSNRDEFGNWSNPLKISENNYNSDIAISDNKVHVVWTEYINSNYTVFYRWKPLNGEWSEKVIIADNLGSGGWGALKLLADASDTLHLMFGAQGYIYEGVYLQKLIDDEWSIEAIPAISRGYRYSDMLVSENGEVHVLNWDDAIYYIHRSSSGNWSSPYMITDQDTQHYMTKAILTNNKLHVIWRLNSNHSDPSTGLYYALRSNDGDWSEVNKITEFTGINEDVRSFWNDSNGGGHLLFKILGGESYYARVSEEGLWTSTTEITPILERSIATSDDDDAIHIISTPIGSGIFYSNFSLPNGDSVLSQEIILSEELNEPRVSFLYQMSGASTSNSTGLQVLVDDGDLLTELTTISTNTSQWDHHSLDLTSWLSKSITLTFNAPQSSNAFPVEVIIDDITVGSTYPDVWVGADGVKEAFGGDEIQYFLHYGNRGGSNANQVKVTLDLSSDLIYVAASPEPTNINGSILEWDIGELTSHSSETISMTVALNLEATPLTYLTSTIEVDLAGGELEDLNNETQFNTFVGDINYLPVLFR